VPVLQVGCGVLLNAWIGRSAFAGRTDRIAAACSAILFPVAVGVAVAIQIGLGRIEFRSGS
jgi:hypothetical protein